MEIILISKTAGLRRRTHLGRWGTRLLALAGIAAIGTAFWAGTRLAAAPEDPRADLYEAAMRYDALQRKREVDDAIRESERGIDALATRLGELQARAIRLDALGRRLVDLGGLDAEELDFTNPPAVGAGSPGAGQTFHVPDFLAALHALSAQLDDRSPKLEVLESDVLVRRLEKEVSPSGRPLDGGWLSSYFGWRADPITGRRSFHEGIDFAGRRNSEIHAVASGVVVRSGHRSGYGKVVEINHGNGISTRYAHNSKNLVRVGQTVKKGDVIALVGATGHATGPHVHFELLRDGKAVNPLKFVRAGR